jgi:hypothetical protein
VFERCYQPTASDENAVLNRSRGGAASGEPEYFDNVQAGGGACVAAYDVR